MASAIENSVRRAIAKGNGEDPEFRVLVYEAAERAIIRGEAEGKTTAAESDAKRRDLIAAVEAIESDYPPVDREAEKHPPSESATPDGRASRDGETADADRHMADGGPAGIDGEVERTPLSTTATSAAVSGSPSQSEGKPGQLWMPGIGRRPAQRSRFSRRIVAIVIIALLAFLVIAGAYLVLPWILPNLFAGTPASRTETDPIGAAIRSASNNPSTGISGDGWTTAFAADGTQGVEAGPRGRVTAVNAADGRAAVRIAATAKPDGGAAGTNAATVAALIVAAGTVSELAGRTARGELTVGSPDATAREFTVSCLVDGASICGRQRFSTSMPSQSFVFNMDVPQATTGPARIAIDPSLGAGANDLNVFRLRLKAA